MNEPIMENTKTVSSLEGNLMRESPIQGISVEWESFFIDEGVLYKRHINEGECGHERRIVLVLPSSLRIGHE